ncbi:hypothetical protein [Asticcacaulis sp. 201]|uniref:hypothetical protein n=1 Tax=Asticcacaulis sp. 201 TaxID=3028787 RepID=UPI002916E115|nr:hypothetical protein [Asticcacaulis sp. 201]MDV6333150.1 hypothetical protein [Asticcacaulis sp. 201]
MSSLFEEFARAVEDIRHKLVEEGWFGRQVTGDAPPPAETLGWDMPPASFDEQWAPAERNTGLDAAHDTDSHGIDR